MITVDRTQFSRAVKLACQVVERRSSMPILTGIKLSANGMLAVTGTDLDILVRAELPYQGDDCELYLCEPRLVDDAIAAAGSDTVELAPADKRLSLKTGALLLDLTTLHPDDFPDTGWDVEPIFECTFTADTLAALKRVKAAISTEETRYYLNGVCMQHVENSTYRFAATDGHRLMMAEIELPDAKGEFPREVILRRDFVKIVLDSFDDPDARLDFAISGKARPYRAGLSGRAGDLGLRVSSKCIDGDYPDYLRVVPINSTVSAKCDSVALVGALKAVSSLSTERMRAVKLTLGAGALICEVSSPDLGKGRYQAEAEHNAPDKFEIAFNARYLFDVISAVGGDRVEILLIDGTSPAIFRKPDDPTFKAVQMPMRV